MYLFFTEFLRPFPILLIWIAMGLFFSWYRHPQARNSLKLIIVPYLFLFILSTPYISYLTTGTLEWRQNRLTSRPSDCEAITVLAGGMHRINQEWTGIELAENTLQRCLHAAELYRAGTPCPIIVSGGRVSPRNSGPTLASAMGDFLVALGVKKSDILLENKSTTTAENAIEIQKILRSHQITKVLLITSATHLPRAEKCFQKQGIHYVSSGAQQRSVGFNFLPYNWLPQPDSIQSVERIWHEWLGLAWYWWKGRI